MQLPINSPCWILCCRWELRDTKQVFTSSSRGQHGLLCIEQWPAVDVLHSRFSCIIREGGLACGALLRMLTRVGKSVAPQHVIWFDNLRNFGSNVLLCPL